MRSYRRAGWLVCAAGCVALGGFLSSGCGGAATPVKEHRAGPSARAKLEQLAARQATSPDELARTLKPEETDSGIVGSLPADQIAPGSKAAMPLDQAVAALRKPPAVPQDTGAPDEASDVEAQKLYARGMQERLAGRALDAVRDLEAAARLSPGSATVWKELAGAQRQLGRRASSIASLKKAAALGSADPQVHAALGREALSADQSEDAAASLIRAREGVKPSDAAQGAIIDADLAQALLKLGYLHASADAMERALATPIENLAASRRREEASELFRRRGEYWQQTGDTWCRLGEYAKAAAAYANAGQTPSLDPGTSTARMVFARLRAGESAHAALALLDQIKDAGGLVEDRGFSLLALIAHSTRVAGLMEESLSELSASLPDAPPSVRSRLARARAAAALDPPSARRTLTGFLATDPGDADVAAALLVSYPESEAPARAEAAARLADASPRDASMYADVLLLCGNGLDAALARLDRSPASPGKNLLETRLLSRLGEFERAPGTLRAVDWAGVRSPGPLGERAQVAASLALWDDANDSLHRLEGMEGREAARARAEVLRALQRFDDAQKLLSELNAAAGATSASDAAHLSELLEVADLSLRVGKAKDAEVFLKRAIEADPFDERAYQALIQLYSKGAPLANDEEALATARSLRQAVPSSRVIRGLTAQELLARSLWPQAQDVLLGMLDRGIETPAVIDLLVSTWERAATARPEMAAEGEKLLHQRLEARPQSPVLLSALVRVLVAEGKPADADSLLQASLKAHPVPELARLRERLLADELGKGDEARSLALARLEHSPRTVDAAIEFVRLSGSGSDFEAAARVLSDWLPPGVTLTSEQAAQLLNVLAGLTPETIASASAKTAEDALRVFDLVASRGVKMPAQMHLVRLTLLARSVPTQTDRIVAAFRQTAEQYPELEEAAVRQVAGTLAAGREIGPALAFLGEVALTSQPVNAGLLADWFRQTALRGSLDDCKRLIDTLTDRERAEITLNEIGMDSSLPEDATARKAEVGYLLGNLLAFYKRDDLSLGVYRYVLTIKPDHAWAANNLGYTMLERGEIDEAQRLMDIAWKTLSDDANVIDSMGWLRYKQGVFEDVKAESGTVTKEGAVTLLRRAAGLEKGDASATVRDHLGDALWRAGSKEEARAAWEDGARLLQEQLTQLRTSLGPRATAPLTQRIADMQKDLQSLRAKAAPGASPDVAPLAKGK